VVVITGEAANDAEKSLVGKLVESIRGVKSVDNNMTVKI
jgi:osmotically-inducible protein OsmY